MRKSLLGPLALAAVFAVAGCGGSNRPAATQSSPTSRVTSASASPTTRPPSSGSASAGSTSTRPAGASPTTRPASAASRTDTSVIPDEGVNVARPVKGVLLNVQAIGSLVTQSFRAPASWHIAYEADCSNLSGAGAFQVALVGSCSQGGREHWCGVPDRGRARTRGRYLPLRHHHPVRLPVAGPSGGRDLKPGRTRVWAALGIERPGPFRWVNWGRTLPGFPVPPLV